MGSQVNFYLVPEDEETFCRFILLDPAVTIVYATRLDAPIVPVEFPLPPATSPYCTEFSLWSRDVASQEQVTPPNKVPDYGNPAGRYDIHAYVYPVIELTRCAFTRDGLSPGRIWVTFEHSRLSPEYQKAFRAWFRRVAGWLNKLPYRWDMYRIGPETKKYFDQGGKAIGYGLGQIRDIKQVEEIDVVRRDVRIDSFSPEVQRDDGKNDLTIELEP